MPKVSTVKITQLVHPQIASAKLRALCDGAAIASKKLGEGLDDFDVACRDASTSAHNSGWLGLSHAQSSERTKRTVLQTGRLRRMAAERLGPSTCRQTGLNG